MYFKEVVKSLVSDHVCFPVEVAKRSSLFGYVDADPGVYYEGEKDHKPDRTVEDSNPKDIPVNGNPAP